MASDSAARRAASSSDALAALAVVGVGAAPVTAAEQPEEIMSFITDEDPMLTN